ncbi:phosphatidylglycerophosphatase [Neoehrlichia mikurensis]|uniref:Phosphatidylglycerophosphatase n=1 Tax=Neoehrlichia mikurensis TaxID=89586 RepID=A0A9Q9BRK7_9RICK|nr:phosphatidylglycerophosphatase [Neoehrlichia mikurensis]QXK92113.1 phosphatidylglycerophosphatase [Neoehrlichia mikurensis]QXK92571.1 phosphatidylglycerophosphatase [Neoehrlichia mikurensis]QXK93807.1 phosphatidylglycerophosphatase [Neoehrlichia mikurensis]UTO55197.1 phosphatidylglycerophosphatase [Neoehrlichia mikurensis]UTO56117.1 phosphatidylglycerophosphatase [Neoehrlichia mikurensis]
MFKSYFQILIKIIGKFLPTTLISTFFGIGYLPAWQSHWASASSLLLCYIVFFLVHGTSYLFSGLMVTGAMIAVFFCKVALSCLILGMISIFVFQVKYQSLQSNQPINCEDNIVIQIVIGQLLVVALSMPATLSIYIHLVDIYDRVCKGIFLCPTWFNNLTYFIIFFAVPFVFFNLIEVIKPWPISFLQLTYNNCFSIMLEGIVIVIYTLIIMYFIAFIYLDLTIQQAIAFNKYIFAFIMR